MATDVTGSPAPAGETSRPANNRTVSATSGQRKPRHRNNKPQSISQLDGTVSDSVINLQSSPRSKKAPKQRQSVAVGALPPTLNTQASQTNGHKPRPASVSANVLGATPQKQQTAYAGPTFHASPAPSSLPVPRFFSKSVPNAAQQTSLEARMEGEKTPEKESASPEPDTVTPVAVRATQQSPLDIFFTADRAEREKRRSTGALLSPESAARSLQAPAIEPVLRQTNPFHGPGKSIFLPEVDVDDEDMPSPRTVPIPSAQLVPRAHSSPGSVPQIGQGADEREAYTKSLKDLLLHNVESPPTARNAPVTSYDRTHSNPHLADPSFSAPSPFHRSASGPATPRPSSAEQAQYSLHYGNRNLSPLFKAARTETPTRPSSLRQELTSGAISETGAADLHHPHNYNPQPRRSLQQQDAATISRNYLDRQIQAAQSASQTPQIPFDNDSVNAGFSDPTLSQRGVQDSHVASTSPRAGGARDVKSMEDDLRRMLKLGVQG